MPTITVREYHPESGSLLGNVTGLDFGKIPAGTTSRVKVIDVAFAGVTQVGNLKLGLVSSGGLTVNPNPEGVDADGSASNGHFGISSSSDFNSSTSSQPLSRHFAGVNTTNTAANSNNVNVGNRTTTISDYIYLDIEIPSTIVTAGNGAYRIFFDYS